MRKIKILIADDHYILREGLISLLELGNNHHNFVIDQAETGEEAIAKVKKHDYDVVFMDYQLPKLDGIAATQILFTLKPHIPVIALSGYNEITLVKKFQQAGAKGYIVKDTRRDELVKAITTVIRGGEYYSNEIALALRNADSHAAKPKRTPSGKKLTERELEILKLITKAHTSEEIAGKLLLSKNTIDKYRQNLLRKMQANSIASLIIQARKFEFIDDSIFS